MSRLIAALCAVSLVACGGENATQPPPPPLPPIVRLELADTSALLFTGSAVPGAAFVAHAYDATGAEVAHPVLTLSAGAGWTVRGDTIIAPSTEGRTTLRISAKRAEPTTADWVHLQGTGGDSVATDSMDVTAGIDLRASSWTVSLICRFPDHTHLADDGTPVDSSAIIAAHVDSILYAGDASWIPNFGGVAQIWASGSAIFWRIDGKADTATATRPHIVLWQQGPDTLYFGGYQYPAPVSVAQDSLRHYVEGGGYPALTLCGDHNAALPDTLRFDEVQ